MSIRYRSISPGELDPALVASWRTIQAENPALSSPYFCPEFTQLVATVRDDVRVVLIEEDSRPVGFFPYQRRFGGMGRPVGGPLSDFHGLIAAPGTPWDLDGVLGASRLSAWAFDHLADTPAQFERFVTRRSAAARIDLRGGYDGYIKGRREAGTSYIGKTEGLARKLGREVGPLRFSLHEAGSESMDQLIAWKRQQYHRSNVPDVFGVAWTGNLLRRIASVQTPPFSGVCSVLRVGDRIVAIHMGMRSNDTLHYWFPAYDPEYSKFSTGIILLLRVAEAAAVAGVRTIDLGIVDAQYKERLMTGSAEVWEGCATRPSLLACMLGLQRAAETRAANGGAAACLRLPLRAIRRYQKLRNFH